ncbi:hypothetical protein B296_00045544 [Ensete ventricosum]|uniref:Uncharacterized protein n=1 Tax=Ensete ventricosum TaxID=4639 RepID=A0A426Z735_ENSVE|nr:hypothetical protein B296_00045544 [Ensete ventricosum]
MSWRPSGRTRIRPGRTPAPHGVRGPRGTGSPGWWRPASLSRPCYEVTCSLPCSFCLLPKELMKTEAHTHISMDGAAEEGEQFGVQVSEGDRRLTRVGDYGGMIG